MTRPLRYAALTAICLYVLIVLLALGEEAALRILTGLDVEYDAEALTERTAA